MDCPQMINFAWFCPHPMELLTCRFKESNKVFDPQSDDTGRFCHAMTFPSAMCLIDTLQLHSLFIRIEFIRLVRLEIAEI